MSVRKTSTKTAKTTTAAEMTTPAKTEEIKTEPVSAKKAHVKRAAAKKTATSTTKKVEVKEAVYIQFAGAEYNLDEIRANVKKAWMDETGKKESDIKDVQIYVKPEEHAAYYVVNQEVAEGGRKINL